MKVKGKQLEDTLRSEASPFTAVHASDFSGNLTGAVRFKAKNQTGSAIAKGSAVYINGVNVNGTVPTVALADANGTGTMPSCGLTEAAANNNAEVYIISFGNLTGLNTAALGTNIVGKSVYISDTAGGLTVTPPSSSSSKLQNIGQIVREHASDGIIKVGGAGRTAATPNLDQGVIFIGNASNQSSESVYTLPIADGTNGQVLTTDGSGAVTFQDASGGGISNVVEDTTPQLGGTLDLNSQAIQGNLIPSAVNTYSLGSASAEWSDLYLGDGAVIYFGTDNDTKLAHSTDTGLLFFLANASEGNAEPVFELRNLQAGNDTGPVIVLNHQGSDANSDVCGILRFMADTSTTNTVYAYVDSTVIERDNGTHAGKLSFYVKSNASDATPLEIIGNSTDNNTETKVTKFLNVADHNGTTGLKLAGTLVTTTASEINVIDGDTSATATTLVDADRVVVNDDGTMKQVAMTDVMTYVNANVSSGGGAQFAGNFESVATADSPVTAEASHHYSVDTSGGAVTINLPALSGVTAGTEIRVKLKTAGNTLTLDGNSTETIDGSETYTLSVQNQAVTLVSDGSGNWEII